MSKSNWTIANNKVFGESKGIVLEAAANATTPNLSIRDNTFEHKDGPDGEAKLYLCL